MRSFAGAVRTGIITASCAATTRERARLTGPHSGGGTRSATALTSDSAAIAPAAASIHLRLRGGRAPSG